MTTSLILIRHGETEWNAQGRLQGHEDIPLNPIGRAQADALGVRLAAEPFHALYSSDLVRALATAQSIAAVSGHEVNRDRRLRERNLGVLQGVHRDTADREMPEVFALYMASDPDYVIPGGESTRQFSTRVRAGIDDLLRRHAGETVVVVAHGGVLDQVYRRAKGLPIAGPRAFTLLNASLNRLSFDAGQWRLGEWGDVRHLEQSMSLDDI
jgi:probable phosphoglycerate mutase